MRRRDIRVPQQPAGVFDSLIRGRFSQLSVDSWWLAVGGCGSIRSPSPGRFWQLSVVSGQLAVVSWQGVPGNLIATGTGPAGITPNLRMHCHRFLAETAAGVRVFPEHFTCPVKSTRTLYRPMSVASAEILSAVQHSRIGVINLPGDRRAPCRCWEGHVRQHAAS